MTEHMGEPDDGDFLDSGVTHEPPAYDVPDDRPAPRWAAALRPAAWLAAGVVAGVVVVSAWHSSTAPAPNANPAAAQGQLPGGPGFGGGPGGSGGPGGGPGFGGGRAGEQHVQGVVTAVGPSSVTVRLDGGGAATYAVVASSDIGKNGSRVPLSAIKPGDAVVVHVYPLNGKTVVEHLFARPATRT